MSAWDLALQAFGTSAIASPVLLLLILGAAAMAHVRLAEPVVGRLTQAAVVCGLLGTSGVLCLMIVSGERYLPLMFGKWVHVQGMHSEFSFVLKFHFDRLSVPFTILIFVLCGTVSEFARRYMHREHGFSRFYLLFALFLSGMVVSSLAGTIETLFLGWEFVGLSSALLVAYFFERRGPVDNGLRIWTVYRLSDAAFLLAALLMHHLQGHGDFGHFTGEGPWPRGHATIGAGSALAVGLLLLLAAAGKSALIPFSGWLPRAMEGPTPSSAVFYGALSVHLGAYLLLRVSPILDHAWALRWCVVILGSGTAISAAITARVQTDVKSSLAYASLTQVGVIVVEIGLGFYYLALIHIIGHACLRTLQLLRAPSILKDYAQMENQLGKRLTNGEAQGMITLPSRLTLNIYRFGFDRGNMDFFLERLVTRPLLSTLTWADRCEHRWTDWIDGKPSRESDFAELHPEANREVA